MELSVDQILAMLYVQYKLRDAHLVDDKYTPKDVSEEYARALGEIAASQNEIEARENAVSGQ